LINQQGGTGQMNHQAPLFRDVTVYDEQEPCPYLEGRMARLPLQIPCPQVTAQHADLRFAAGQRRTGEFVYSTRCPSCSACQPIRIPVTAFRLSRTHRRTLRTNESVLTPYIGPVLADRPRIELFNRHREIRALGRRDSHIDIDEYVWAFQKSCFDTFEISWSLENRLVAVAICDQGQSSMSAVYTYYDPDLGRMSLGTWSILRQIEYCRATRRDYLYLGFYIAESGRMSYKARFFPHERLINGRWQRFDSDAG
jgi:arginine-tRNA-protein transferase